jgi:cytochrome c oxidase subunit III
MAQGEAKHDYHLVEPSAWPIVGSVAAFLMMVGAIMAMHGGKLTFSLVAGEKGGLTLAFGPWVFVIGVVLLLTMFFGWWADVIKEGEKEGHHTPTVQIGLRYGMILFIASEVMFFVAWFWAYFDAALFVQETKEFARNVFTGGVWPPKGIKTFNPWDVPLLNTLILLTSGTTVTWAHHSIIHGDRKGLVQGLALTVLLGMSFTGLQALEYSEAGFKYAGHIYGATFFMATGFHGFHVIVGTIFLAVCLFRAMAGHFKPDQHFGLEAAAWYWHFVDVVWLFLFTCIYVFGAGTPGAE